MSVQPSIADWITAASTGVTAIATIVTGTVSWLAFRREIRAVMPIVECDLGWMGPESGDFILLMLITRNRHYESITLDSVHVRHPQGMFISDTTATLPDGRVGIPIAGADEKISIRHVISPTGSGGHSAFDNRTTRSDISRCRLYMSPPKGWAGGLIKIEIWISSRTLSVRSKRITIKRILPSRTDQ